MRKILIWGMGKIFDEHAYLLEPDNLVAIIDNKKCLSINNWKGIPVISEQKILEYEFDEVCIFTNRFISEIETALINKYAVQKQNIHIWTYAIFYSNLHNEWICRPSLDIIIELISNWGFESFEDGYGRIMKYGYKISQMIWKIKDITYNSRGTKNIYSFLYRRGKCESILFLDPFIRLNPMQFYESAIKNSLDVNVFFNVPFHGFESSEEWSNYDYSSWGDVTIIPYRYGKLIWLHRVIQLNENNNSIYVVTHKKITLQTKDTMYKIIQAGAEGKQDMGYISDATADNISTWNTYINECTALYWIWKNDKKSEYIGLNHYRRYFGSPYGNKERIIDSGELGVLLKKYDIIVGAAHFSYPRNIREDLKRTVDVKAYREGMSIIRTLLKEKCPEYLKSFETVMNDYSFYKCNMFIMHRKVLQTYCKWLFTLLIPACKQFNIETYDPYSQRMIGFIAERLLTVWLMDKSFKIKELPIIQIENM